MASSELLLVCPLPYALDGRILYNEEQLYRTVGVVFTSKEERSSALDVT